MTDWRGLCADLVAAWDSWVQRADVIVNGNIDAVNATGRMVEAANEARAALAQPAPEGPGPVDYRRWYEAHSEDCNTWSEQPTAPLTLRTTVEALAWANYCLARYALPAIEPVPVGERPWEREGWCDAEGNLWAEHISRGGTASWRYANHDFLGGWCQRCLPHWALPVPSSPTNE